MKLSVNGRDHDIAADPATPLLWVLRDELGLTGTKFGCGIAAPLVIESYFVDRPDVHPTGLGEPSVPPLANALYRATGKRYRSLPLVPHVA